MDQNEARPTTLGVPMLDSEVVKQLKALTALRWGRKRIARELGISPNSVLRYQRSGDAALVQQRPRARRLTAAELARAIELLDSTARGNAVVVQRLLAAEGVTVSLRTLQRRLRPHHHEPHQRIADPSHFDGLYRRADDRASAAAPLARSLDVYASCIGGDA